MSHGRMEPEPLKAAQVNVFLRQRRHDEKGMVWIRIKRALSWPLMQITHLLKWILSRIMLQACEVAQEYMLSLIYAPQVSQPEQTCFSKEGKSGKVRRESVHWAFIMHLPPSEWG